MANQMLRRISEFTSDLVETEISIDALEARYGFTCKSTLYRNFRKHFYTTPMKYREVGKKWGLYTSVNLENYMDKSSRSIEEIIMNGSCMIYQLRKYSITDPNNLFVKKIYEFVLEEIRYKKYSDFAIIDFTFTNGEFMGLFTDDELFYLNNNILPQVRKGKHTVVLSKSDLGSCDYHKSLDLSEFCRKLYEFELKISDGYDGSWLRSRLLATSITPNKETESYKLSFGV